MYSYFDYIKIDPQYYIFFQIVLDYFFSRLLEIKKILRD